MQVIEGRKEVSKNKLKYAEKFKGNIVEKDDTPKSQHKQQEYNGTYSVPVLLCTGRTFTVELRKTNRRKPKPNLNRP